MKKARRYLAALKKTFGGLIKKIMRIPWLHVSFLVLATLLMVISSSWLADLIKGGDCLFSYCRTCSGVDAVGIIISLALFLVGAVIFVSLTHRYSLPRVLEMKGVKGYKALIVPVSTLDKDAQIAEDGKSVSWHTPNRVFTLPDGQDIVASIRALEELKKEKIRTSAQQFLRVIRPHAETLRHVCLICSDRSRRETALYANLIRHYLGARVEVQCVAEPLDFGNLDAVRTRVLELCRDLQKKPDIRSEDIMIDATGGTKTASIALALATLHDPDLHFQYVPTDQGPSQDDKEPDVVQYDVVTEVNPKLGL